MPEKMHRSSGKIRSLSVEYIDSFENFELETLVVERYVSDPHDEIITAKTENKRKILIAYSERKRRIIQFELFDVCSDENTITLWDLMEILEIRCGHRSLIAAVKKCKQNILYAIEMERGFLFVELAKMHDDEWDIYGKSVEEIRVEKEASVSEIKIEDSIVTKKKNLIEQSKHGKKRNITNNNVSNKKISLSNDRSKSEKIAQFKVDGVVTYTFYMSDYCCLAEKEWLNDLIIDWYLMFLYSKVISISDRERTFIYSSLFFAVLREDASKTEKLAHDSNERFQKVQQFTGKINIFEKDFVIIPVNEHESHWYLIIICFLGLVDSHQIDDASQSMSSLSLTNDDDNYEKKSPCILIFDSYKNYKKNRDEKLLREYLSYQYYKYYNEHKIFSESNLSCDYPSVPKQRNSSDCGIFVLQYVESFFKNPIKNFNLPIKSLKNWFPSEVVRKKRALLARILRKMSRETVGKDVVINFPTLRFGDSPYSDDQNTSVEFV